LGAKTKWQGKTKRKKNRSRVWRAKQKPFSLLEGDKLIDIWEKRGNSKIVRTISPPANFGASFKDGKWWKG